MVVFGVEGHQGLARIGRITQWRIASIMEKGDSSNTNLDHETPSFMVTLALNLLNYTYF
jgi:hypothetical protein